MIKSFFATLTLLATLTACQAPTPAPTAWEYQVIELPCENPAVTFKPSTFENPTSLLNVMGSKGWELVDTYTDVQTTFPNFGDEQYNTGIRENTHTHCLHFVFKRPLTSQSKE